MPSERRITRLFARIAACSCLLSVACVGHAPDPSKPFAAISPQHPMASATVLQHLFEGGRRLCARRDFRAEARVSEPECLDHIRNTRAMCERKSLATMPAAISRKGDLHKVGRQFYHCLMPE